MPQDVDSDAEGREGAGAGGVADHRLLSSCFLLVLEPITGIAALRRWSAREGRPGGKVTTCHEGDTQRDSLSQLSRCKPPISWRNHTKEASSHLGWRKCGAVGRGGRNRGGWRWRPEQSSRVAR